MASEKITVTLIKSTNRRLQSHKDCVRGLGLRKINDTVTVERTPENMGMINKVSYLLKVE
ncbi:50S ribosomal protein L30 [Ignatzschineria sp. RMDPL8A]|uniref:50S ribosomal protein L30 n=1 Tax=Ignatzschineria sp. RMDPL8A TaxID=2999236 RepID=UPI0016AE76C1|nr:50S ribosomal protein L30 [Ignatzschineria sp. RMDPL8A]MDG9729508.1 50S ribosomal protein L30 [Ignatzschineria sp. RMDPL8A]NLD07972.1 50S ribosomal protein L30 [Xanthomonadaceae bacterium]